MVLRERKINNKSDNVQLQVSFGLPDVKALLKIYASIGDEEFNQTYPNTEQDIIYWLSHDGRAFLSWPDRWRDELSKWVFAVALRNGILVQSAAAKNIYYLADCLFARRGRPPKKE